MTENELEDQIIREAINIAQYFSFCALDEEQKFYLSKRMQEWEMQK